MNIIYSIHISHIYRTSESHDSIRARQHRRPAELVDIGSTTAMSIDSRTTPQI